MTFEVTDSVIDDLNEAKLPDPQLFTTEFISRASHGVARCVDQDNRPFSIKSGSSYEITFN